MPSQFHGEKTITLSPTFSRSRSAPFAETPSSCSRLMRRQQVEAVMPAFRRFQRRTDPVFLDLVQNPQIAAVELDLHCSFHFSGSGAIDTSRSQPARPPARRIEKVALRLRS